MNYVAAHQKRYTETAFLNGNALHFVNDFNIDLVQYGADLARLDGFSKASRNGAIGRIDLGHLADLFGHVHATKQVINALFN